MSIIAMIMSIKVILILASLASLSQQSSYLATDHLKSQDGVNVCPSPDELATAEDDVHSSAVPLRICLDQDAADENVIISFVDIYVK